MRFSHSIVARIIVAAALLTPAASAAQKPGEKKPAAAAKPTVDTKALGLELKSADEAQVGEALDALRTAGVAGAPAAPAVADALGRGLSLPLTQSAIETLGDLESEAGTPVLTQYAAHRNAKVRRAAVKSLARTKGAGAVPALRRALADADGVVRATAASGLGSLKAKDAVPELFVALDHKVNEAAASIGQLCNPAQCEQLAAKLGKLPLDVVTGGLDAVLFRPTADVSDDAKLKIVALLRAQGTSEGNKFLRDVQKRWPAGQSPRVRQAIDEAVMATAGGPQ
ncbi:MAG: hypothetical protein JWP97_291 [Labilithrix sp.]|nr:hypothetical protein [Labilithrix sp.]